MYLEVEDNRTVVVRRYDFGISLHVFETNSGWRVETAPSQCEVLLQPAEALEVAEGLLAAVKEELRK